MRSRIDPVEAEELLRWAKKHGFGAWHLVNATRPTMIVLFRQWGRWIDVVHVRGADRVEAARLCHGENADIWRPRDVVWHYFGNVVNAVTALRRLGTHSDVPYAVPRDGHPIPLHVSDDELAANRHYFPPTDFPVPVMEG